VPQHDGRREIVREDLLALVLDESSKFTPVPFAAFCAMFAEVVRDRDAADVFMRTFVEEQPNVAAIWDRARQRGEVGVDVDPSARRANILVRGVDLENSGGKVLRLGSILVLLHAETRPCELMDEMQPGLRAALKPHWRAGAYGENVTEPADVPHALRRGLDEVRRGTPAVISVRLPRLMRAD
jgi:hypothetical protein